MNYDVSHIQDPQKHAGEILTTVTTNQNQAGLITLVGNLGAGKTTFTQKLGGILGIPEEDINSPTYVIEQRYHIPDHSAFSELVHIDAYRLEQADDPYKIGLDQTLGDPTKLVVIEWPEKVQDFLKDYRATQITLTLDGEKRSLEVR